MNRRVIRSTFSFAYLQEEVVFPTYDTLDADQSVVPSLSSIKSRRTGAFCMFPPDNCVFCKGFHSLLFLFCKYVILIQICKLEIAKYYFY